MTEAAGLLTGMVICQNEAARIADCLASLSFCDEVLVIDSGSTDGTQAIVRASGATLIERHWLGWNDQKDFGRAQARGRWVLNIDADEVVTADLRAEITQAIAGAADDVAGFRIPFRTHFRSAWVRTCGYHPDHHIRLVRGDRARWDRDAVHDRVVTEGRVCTLTSHIDHY